MRPGIALTSLALTTAVIGNAYYQKRQFYPSVVYITKSNPSMAVMYAQAFLFVIFLGKLMQKVFFGQILAAELEHLMDRSWYAVTETCLAFTVFRDDVSPSFLALFTTLLFLKAFHWLAEERVDFMERSPVISLTFHLRLISLMIFLGIIDIQFVGHAYQSTISKGASTQLVFGFEYAVLFTIVINIAIKYTLHTIDLHADTPWENKAVFLLYTELVMGFFRVVLYLSFLVIMVRIYTLPLFITRPMYLALRAFKRAFNDVIMSRRAIRNMNTLYPDATPEELAAADNVCIICREEMVGASKKLPCNHIFHTACLRSWFQRQQTCPTCRHNILRTRRSQSGVNINGANNAGANAGGAAPGVAAAAAGPNAAPAANQPAAAGPENQQGQAWAGQMFGAVNPMMYGFLVNALWQQQIQQRQQQQPSQQSSPQAQQQPPQPDQQPQQQPQGQSEQQPQPQPQSEQPQQQSEGVGTGAGASSTATNSASAQGASGAPDAGQSSTIPPPNAGSAGSSRQRGVPTFPPFPPGLGFPFLCPPFPIVPPYVVPPPVPPANLTTLSDAELRQMESSTREGVLARLQYLKNIQMMLDASAVMMSQYSTASAAACVAQTRPTDAQNSAATQATMSGDGEAGTSNNTPSSSADHKTESADTGEAAGSAASASGASKPSSRTENETDEPVTREQDELRRKRLQRFANEENVD